MTQKAQKAFLIVRRGEKLGLKLEPISKEEVPYRGKYSEVVIPLIGEIEKTMHEAYKVDVTQYGQRKQYRIYDAIKNALKPKKHLPYEVHMAKGVIYLVRTSLATHTQTRSKN